MVEVSFFAAEFLLTMLVLHRKHYHALVIVSKSDMNKLTIIVSYYTYLLPQY